MPTIINTFEGMAVGTVPTTGNTGGTSGNAMSATNIGAGNEVQVVEDGAHGNRSLQFDYGTTALATAHWAFSEAGRSVFSAYVYLETLPTSFEDILYMRHSGGYVGLLVIGSDGKLILQNATGGGLSATRAPDVFPIGEWVLVQMARTKGTTTSNGILEYSYYRAGSNTAVYSRTEPAVNAGTANTAVVGIGRIIFRSEPRVVKYDTMRAETLTTGWLTQYAAPNRAPELTLTQTATGIEPGETQELNATVTDPDNTLTGLTITQVSGTPTVTLIGTGDTRTYTAPPTLTGTTLGFTATATNTAGPAVTSDTITHTIYPATERVGALPAYLRFGS